MAEHIDPFDPSRPVERDDVVVERPRPGHPLVVRAHDRLDPWIAWFGVRRIVLTAITVVALVVGGWWLLRAPPPPTEAGLPFVATSTSAVTVVAPTAPGHHRRRRSPPTS